MTLINFVGFETGDLKEVDVTGAGISVQSTTKRTGDYALQVNPSGTASRAIVRNARADPAHFFPDGQSLWITLYFRFGTLPGSAETFCVVGNGVTLAMAVQCDASGNITLFDGSSSSSTIATISTGVWYRLDFKYIDAGTCEAKINGAGTQTLTATDAASNFVYLGSRHSTVTYNCYIDDVVLSDSAYATTPQVVRCDTDGDGTDNTTFSPSGFAAVDEVPPDDATTVISSATSGSLKSTTVESASSAGVVGAIAAVKAVIAFTTIGVNCNAAAGVRVSSSTADEATGVVSNAAWRATSYVAEVDPSTSAAWTSGGVDSAQPRVTTVNNFSEQVDVTSMYLMVLSDGFTVSPNPPRPVFVRQAIQRAANW